MRRKVAPPDGLGRLRIKPPSEPLEIAMAFDSLREPLRGARIWGAAERSRAETGTPVPRCERPGYDRYVTAARISSGNDAAFDNAWQEGRCLTLDQTIDLALVKAAEGR